MGNVWNCGLPSLLSKLIAPSDLLFPILCEAVLRFRCQKRVRCQKNKMWSFLQLSVSEKYLFLPVEGYRLFRCENFKVRICGKFGKVTSQTLVGCLALVWIYSFPEPASVCLAHWKIQVIIWRECPFLVLDGKGTKTNPLICLILRIAHTLILLKY